jgi:hypothetical protein
MLLLCSVILVQCWAPGLPGTACCKAQPPIMLDTARTHNADSHLLTMLLSCHLPPAPLYLFLHSAAVLSEFAAAEQSLSVLLGWLVDQAARLRAALAALLLQLATTLEHWQLPEGLLQPLPAAAAGTKVRCCCCCCCCCWCCVGFSCCCCCCCSITCCRSNKCSPCNGGEPATAPTCTCSIPCNLPLACCPVFAATAAAHHARLYVTAWSMARTVHEFILSSTVLFPLPVSACRLLQHWCLPPLAP